MATNYRSGKADYLDKRDRSAGRGPTSHGPDRTSQIIMRMSKYGTPRTQTTGDAVVATRQHMVRTDQAKRRSKPVTLARTTIQETDE